MKIDVQYEVETGVPVPVRNTSPRLSIGRLEVGQSIVFSLEKRATVQSNASRIKKYEGKEFTIKKIDDKQCRIWRVI